MSNLEELNYAIISELRDQLEAKEQMIKKLKSDLKRAEVYLMACEYETPALGGKKKDMERALLNIDRYCRDYFGDWDDTNWTAIRRHTADRMVLLQ